MSERPVPAELARLWRLPAESRLGRPAALDPDTVVRAAVELADRDGLAGATLPKVARALGCTAMALYRHVGSKDELLNLMRDFALGAPPEEAGDPGAGGWRDALRGWALGQVAAYARHPWLVDVPVSGPPGGPHGIGWLDSGLRALRGTRLDWAEKVGALNVLGGYVRSALQQNRELADGRAGTGLDQEETEREYGRALLGLVDPERFPEAARLFTSGLFEAAPPRTDGEPVDHDFAFGLDLVLDGVAAAVTRAET